MKLRNKFFLVFAILAIIPLLIITFFAYSRYMQQSYDRMVEISENTFRNAVAEADSTLSRIKQSLSYLTFYADNDEYSIIETIKPFSGNSDSYTSYDILKASQYCNSVFQNIMLTDDNIYGIHIFTPSGVIFSCSFSQGSNLKGSYDPTTSQWYKDTLKLDGSLYINIVDESDMFTANNTSVFFAQCIKDVYTHEFLGVILMDCNPGIFDLNNVNAMPESALLYISNKDTNVTLYSNLDTLADDFYESDRTAMKANLSITPLELTAAFNYDSMYRQFQVTGILLLVIAVTCMAIFLIVSYLMTKNMIRPLEDLSQTMSHQDYRDSDFQSPYMRRTDEIGALYNEYAGMLEELNASIKRDYQNKLIILDAQMKSLESRINSHLLFNTLESINSMAEIDDNEQIATMSLALGNMFRYSIKTTSELVTLAEELNNVKDYVSIQSIRFSNRFHLDLDIPEDLYQRKVLKLILQPLVENAFYHGLDYCTKGDLIEIKCRKEDFTLFLSVRDNGQGMAPEKLAEIRRSLQEEARFTELGHRNKQSIGLKNIHSRIELYYGKGYGLLIDSAPGEGTVITIKIPILQ